MSCKTLLIEAQKIRNHSIQYTRFKMIAKKQTVATFASLLFFTILVSSCGVIPRTPSSDTLATLGEGRASWYGPNFHGKLTANGEIFDMNDLTAAHRTLPFNTMVRVDNLDNGRTIVVRINDRGPYVDNRIIDLSRKAAADLGMISAGTASVRLSLIREGDRPVTEQNSSSRETFTIQIASFENMSEAEVKAESITGSRVEEVRLNNSTFYRVYYGIYYSVDEAKAAENTLKADGINGFVKQIEN